MFTTFPVGKITKNSLQECFLLIWHSKYRVILSKIHSYRLLFLAILEFNKKGCSILAVSCSILADLLYNFWRFFLDGDLSYDNMIRDINRKEDELRILHGECVDCV